MAIIRIGEEGFTAYIYLDGGNNKVNISTPSYTGVVRLGEAVKILNLLVKLNEVPSDIHERLFAEVEDAMATQDKINEELTIKVEELQHAAKQK